MDDLNDVYNDLIMEHSMNSYNKRKLDNPTYCEMGHNPNCGDEIEIELKLNNDIIEDMAFTRTWLCNITSINFNNDRHIKRKKHKRSKRNNKDIH